MQNTRIPAIHGREDVRDHWIGIELCGLRRPLKFAKSWSSLGVGKTALIQSVGHKRMTSDVSCRGRVDAWSSQGTFLARNNSCSKMSQLDDSLARHQRTVAAPIV